MRVEGLVNNKGSIWRKWDLHIHTPASFDWKGKRYPEMDDDEKYQTILNIITKMNATDIDVFGIMDHWTFDGYNEIQRFLKENPEIILHKTLLPGIELRVDAPVDYNLNIHVLLSNNLTSQQLSDFKNALSISLIDRPLSDEALVNLGRQMGEDKLNKHGFKNEDKSSEEKMYNFGCMIAKVTKESLKTALNSVPKKSAFVILPYDTKGGVRDLDWETQPTDDVFFLKFADIFEVRNPDNINLFLGVETNANTCFIKNFISALGGYPKPVVSGSDAHSIKEYGNYPNNKITWLKADPTFEGLKQITIEPKTRCYIGEMPEKLKIVNKNKTKYIKSVHIKKNIINDSEKWFENIKLDFNHDLVAIIGNKGSGKSALVDIIGLLGNSHCDLFSFLNTRRFRNTRDNKAKDFEALLVWENDDDPESCIIKNLDSDVKPHDVELVKYLSQQYFENVCNESEPIDDANSESPFDRELKDVIFSHVTESNKLGFESLTELLKYRTEVIIEKKTILVNELNSINVKIIDLEGQISEENKKHLYEQLKNKELEYQSHQKLYPPEPPKPGTGETEKTITDTSSLLESKNKAKDELEAKIHDLVNKHKNNILLLSKVERIVSKLDNLQKYYDSSLPDINEELKTLDIDIRSVIKLEINKEIILQKQSEYINENRKIDALLDQDIDNSLTAQLDNIKNEILNLQNKLDEPHKKYQIYLESYKKWLSEREDLVGNPEKVGTIEYYKQRIKTIEDVIPVQLSQAKEERLKKSKEIFNEIVNQTTVYKELYGPAQEDFHKALTYYNLDNEKFLLNFEVTIEENGFLNKFFNTVRQDIKSTFCGSDPGQKKLKDILNKYDFNNESNLLEFLDEITYSMEFDLRDEKKNPINVSKLMKKGTSLLNLYNDIYSLDYLKPKYLLKHGNKEIKQLSPGEKGALLLMFYLLVDNNNIPLIIDQPEENLDSQTLYELLVQCIKEAKTRRQIFIVTHSPVLAVVCDAEQIICANIDKLDKNCVSYVSGSIENPEIKNNIINILEGTWPAFRNRGLKYHIFDDKDRNNLLLYL